MVIDASAVLMTAVSLTGLILIFSIKRRRFAGVVVAILGTLALAALWFWAVP